jgi:hypothetical protein
MDIVYHRKPYTMERLREEIEMPCAAIPVDSIILVH